MGDPVASDTKARLLVVEDDADVRGALVAALEHVGHEVRAVSSGEAAIALAASWAPDLVVLDVNLPGRDGFETCAQLRRADEALPVVFLTARRDLEDLRRGLGGGAEDYVTKPFSVEELTIRLDAALRRSRDRGGDRDAGDRLALGPVVLDVAARRAWSEGAEVHLTPTEFRMLHYLMANAGRAVSREQIVDYVWRYEFDGDARIVETYVSGLRRKLGERAAALLRTVRGYGYSFRRPDAP